MVGGGSQARPGEISLAHKGVLFLDELPEFAAPGARGAAPAARGRPGHGRARQRARHLPGPVPARGGHEPLPLRLPRRPGAGLPAGAALRRSTTRRGISGPLLDRIDLHVEVPPVSVADMALPAPREGTAEVAARVAAGAAAPGRALRRRRRSPSCAPTARPTASCSSGSPLRRARGRRAAAPRRASSCTSAPAATTACCGWRGRSPTSTARRPSASRTSPRPSAFRRMRPQAPRQLSARPSTRRARRGMASRLRASVWRRTG